MNNIWLSFITGLTTGGISCLAVQGGLLASSITNSEENATRIEKYSKVGSFLIAKLLGYTLLGFGLGLIGSRLVLTPNILGWMQIAAGIFMLGTAGRLLNLHPIFRYFQIQPPKFAYRILRNESKSNSLFGPALLGFMTILIPCGVTQAMMALAIASANPFFGTGIMFAFVLGTSPVFFAMGVTALELLKNKLFVYAAATVIVILGIVSINNGQVIRGSYHTLGNYWKALTDDGTSKGGGIVAGVNAQGVQEATINVYSQGYKGLQNTLKVGVPTKLTLISNDVTSCARSFIIPAYNISKVLPQNGTTEIEFTPTKTGTLAYSCGMGMYTGQFTVVN